MENKIQNVDSFLSSIEKDMSIVIQKHKEEMLMAGDFHKPEVNPFQIPKPYPEQPSNEMVTSQYLANNYYIDFTPSWWRAAIDRALLYSDLSYLDVMYSWCVQSSPFLTSLIDKRMRPFLQRKYIIRKADGTEWKEMSKLVCNSEWFNDMRRAILLSSFYGVQVISIDPVNDKSVNYPIRNIDMFNKALREGTFEYTSIVNVSEYDNMFYFQPYKEQDFRLGTLQQISRVMISMIKAGNDWQMANENYAYPMKVVEYANNSETAKKAAQDIARSPSPAMIPITPFTPTLSEREPIPELRIKPVNTQMYPESFRSFKELMDKYESYIMQLILGGTLMGATEKNTNSEQLAEIHLGMFEDIKDVDEKNESRMLNNSTTLYKLSKLFGIPELLTCSFEAEPTKKIEIRKFKIVGEILAKMGMRFKPEILKKVGLEPTDIDIKVQNNSWSPFEKWAQKVSSIISPKKKQNESR